MKFSLVCEDNEGNLCIREVKNPAVEVIKELGATEKIAQFIKWEQKSRRSQYQHDPIVENADSFLRTLGVL